MSGPNNGVPTSGRWNRRRALQAALTSLLGATCTGRADDVAAPEKHGPLARLLYDEDGTRVLAGIALVVERGGKLLTAQAHGSAGGLDHSVTNDPPRPLSVRSKLRVASVSKLVVALCAGRLAERGLIDLDRNLRPMFPVLRHPRFPDAPLTLRHLLSHTSTVRDPVDEAYYAVSPAAIETILGPHLMNPQARAPAGAWFEYCNLNFGLAATVLERATGERFDRLARRLVLAPAGLTGGFNWSGVEPADRRAGATLYRRFDDGWRTQADGPAVLEGTEPVALVAEGFKLADYRIGSNGTLFSPQGGLRISALELARLARVAGTDPALQPVLWRLQTDEAGRQNGDPWGGAFFEAGLGCFRWPAERSPIPGVAMIGHDGEAYGLYSGCWYLPAYDAAVGFAITGTPAGEQPAGGKHPGYNRWSQHCFDAAAAVLGLA